MPACSPRKVSIMRLGADCSQAGSQGRSSIRGLDWNFFLQQDVTGIEAGIDSHGGDASAFLRRERSPTEWAPPRDIWATTTHAD